MAKIDVLMPAKNSAKYVAEAVESLQAQSFSDWRLVFVDNGSRDETLEIVAGIDDARIEVFECPNGNLPQALNFGLAKCDAPFVARMDSDDVSLPERFMMTLEMFDREPDAQVASGSIEFTDEKLVPFGRKAVELSPAQITRKMPIENMIMGGAAMFRRTLAERIGGYHEGFALAEDLDFWLRAEPALMVNRKDVLLKYRKHAQATTTKRHELIYYTACARMNYAARALGLDEIAPDYSEAGFAAVFEKLVEIAPLRKRPILKRVVALTVRQMRKFELLTEAQAAQVGV